MKKLNNKGFLLVETLVVATFCLTVLVILFLQFKNLVVSYNNSYKYNTVEGIYNLNTVKKYLNQNNLNFSGNYEIITTVADDKNVCTEKYNLGAASTNNYYCDRIIKAGNFKTIIYTKANISSIKSELNTNTNLSEGMKNFISQINKYDNNKRLIAEFSNDTYATITY